MRSTNSSMDQTCQIMLTEVRHIILKVTLRNRLDSRYASYMIKDVIIYETWQGNWLQKQMKV
jgi:hypothetical protein